MYLAACVGGSQSCSAQTHPALQSFRRHSSCGFDPPAREYEVMTRWFGWWVAPASGNPEGFPGPGCSHPRPPPPACSGYLSRLQTPVSRPAVEHPLPPQAQGSGRSLVLNWLEIRHPGSPREPSSVEAGSQLLPSKAFSLAPSADCPRWKPASELE